MARTARACGLMIAALGLLVGCARTDLPASTVRATSPPRPAIGDTADAPPDSTEAPADDGFPQDWRPPSLDWQRCDLPRGGRCATLTVPLDWSDPRGPTIDLEVGRIPAEGERIGSLLMNPGGPGGSGLEFLSYDVPSTALADRFDLVSWDPRGVGASTAVRCGDAVQGLVSADPDPDSAEEQGALDEAAAALSAECGAEDGALLGHLGTVDVARDMEAIRRTLGDEQLDYMGFSYGTQIGQQYAALFPDRIRAMVLDGVVDPSLDFEQFLIAQSVAFEDAFDRGTEACAAAGRRRCGVDDLDAAYQDVRATVERTPLPGGDQPVGPAALATAAIQTSYGPDGWQDLGPALAAALDGDGAPLWDLAASYYDFGGFASYAAVVCTDTPPPKGARAYQAFADRARAAAPRFGGSVANELAPCATWPAAPVGRPGPVTAPSAPPILVIGNTGDAATPYRNAVDVADALRSGVLVTARIEGHTAYMADGCVTDIVDAYLIDLEVPPQDTICD